MDGKRGLKMVVIALATQKYNLNRRTCRKDNDLTSITIFTDRYHYLGGRSGHVRKYQNLPENYKEIIKRTFRWKFWFEKLVLKRKNGLQNLEHEIYETLYCCYRRALCSLDSEHFGEFRETPVLVLMKKLEKEVEFFVKEAKKFSVNDRIVERFLDKFERIKIIVKAWLIREINRT